MNPLEEVERTSFCSSLKKQSFTGAELMGLVFLSGEVIDLWHPEFIIKIVSTIAIKMNFKLEKH